MQLHRFVKLKLARRAQSVRRVIFARSRRWSSFSVFGNGGFFYENNAFAARIQMLSDSGKIRKILQTGGDGKWKQAVVAA